MKKIDISVVDLAQPTPKVGSIDTYSGFGLTSKLAIKAHQTFQLNQSKANQSYCPEVAITHTFVYKRHRFVISGRMDGIYKEKPFRIEEIKTAFEPHQLITVLNTNYFTHPYWLQLQLYGYIHWLKTNTLPQLDLLILSLRNHKTHTLSLEFDTDQFKKWLDQRFDELIKEIKESKKRSAHRQKESSKLTFPFTDPRPQQKELMDTVVMGMKKKSPMLIQAPTGLGKSIGILYPTLKESLSRGQKTIYLTPKNTQHQIALNAVRLMQAKGSSCKSIILTSKKKLCMKNEPLCSSKHCEFAENHYSKCTSNELIKKARKKKNLDERFFKDMAKTYQVCPYELQMDCVAGADVVIGDYNYVFSANNAPSRVIAMPLGEEGKPNLVVDEVHNLPHRGMSYFSPTLHIGLFEGLLNSLTNCPLALRDTFASLLQQCLALVHGSAVPQIRGPHRVSVDYKAFAQQEECLYQFLGQYLELDIPIESNDAVLHLCNYWSDFTAALELLQEERDEFFISFNPQTNTLKINCCDASSFLQDSYIHFEQVIGFSATLKPFDYYSRLIGLNTEHLQTHEFASPFAIAHRKLLIIPQVSTKYRARISNISKIIAVIQRITALKPGNYLIFFPSFEFLEQTLKQMTIPEGFHLVRQERTMNLIQINDFFKKIQQKDKAQLIFAVQGGIFAEGIDYVGDLAIGVFIIGPPLPHFDWEREQMKQYYDSRYQAGDEYAYIVPAMAKSIQAAGRVIRTESDRGIIVFLDNRFLEPTYSQCMPHDWFENQPEELVSRTILQDIESFWQKIL